jgi:hypothetical protein
VAIDVPSSVATAVSPSTSKVSLPPISSAAADAIWSAFETGAARAAILFSVGELPFDATSWIFGVPYGEGSLAERTDLPGELLFLATLTWAAAGLFLVVRRYVTWEP